jgi:hypothetical protein
MGQTSVPKMLVAHQKLMLSYNPKTFKQLMIDVNDSNRYFVHTVDFGLVQPKVNNPEPCYFNFVVFSLLIDIVSYTD